MNIRFIIISLGLVLWSSFMKMDTTPPFKLIVFQGSDWCEKCIVFEKNVLKDPLFVEKMEYWHIEMEKIDFPQRKKLSKDTKKYNAYMADKYKFDGSFPTVLLSRTDVLTYKKIPYSTFDASVFLKEIEHVLKELNPSQHED